MRIEDHLEFPHSCVAIAAMLADPEFVRARCVAQHAHSVSVQVNPSDDGGFTVVSTRTQSTEDVPAQLRSLVGAGLTLRQHDGWGPPSGDGSRSGSIVVEVVGFPVRFTGSLRLAPSASGCRETLSGDLVANIPFFGSRVEQAAAPAITAAVRAEAKAATAWLQEVQPD